MMSDLSIKEGQEAFQTIPIFDGRLFGKSSRKWSGWIADCTDTPKG
ncbi:MAG TPA: hypothetical protein K8V20_11665 [Subdoligranulum variabile]|uniref:Uncharacterized protein n=1 Tax=Subdoligranulum variabile TaxID=214851 RepID=A0A921IL49_9FIRM|nr:hypothetical protein [Subdoligranulum variabile]